MAAPLKTFKRQNHFIEQTEPVISPLNKIFHVYPDFHCPKAMSDRRHRRIKRFLVAEETCAINRGLISRRTKLRFKNKALRTIIITEAQERIPLSHIKHFSYILRTQPHLRSLKILAENAYMLGREAKYLAHSMRNLRDLKILVFNGPETGPQGWNYITFGIQRLIFLKYLDLFYDIDTLGDISSETAFSNLHKAFRYVNSLKDLILRLSCSTDEMSPEGMESLIKALNYQTSLESFKMEVFYSFELDQEEALANLSKFLSKHKTLKSLDLNLENWFCSKNSIKSITEGFQGIETLKNLRLRLEIREKDRVRIFKELAKALGTREQLESLVLEFTELVDDETVDILSASLQKLTQLQCLILSFDHPVLRPGALTNEGFAKLMKRISHLKKLKTLEIFANGYEDLSDESVVAIKETIDQLPALENIDFEFPGWKIDQRELERLSKP